MYPDKFQKTQNIYHYYLPISWHLVETAKQKADEQKTGKAWVALNIPEATAKFWFCWDAMLIILSNESDFYFISVIWHYHITL